MGLLDGRQRARNKSLSRNAAVDSVYSLPPVNIAHSPCASILSVQKLRIAEPPVSAFGVRMEAVRPTRNNSDAGVFQLEYGNGTIYKMLSCWSDYLACK